MKEAEEKILIEMGDIPLETIEGWANKSEKFREVFFDEKRLQEAFEASEERLKNTGVPMGYLKEITREIFDVAAKRAFAIMYARAAVEKFFQGKTTMEEIDREIFNDEWICATVEKAMQWHVEAAMHAAENAMIREAMASGRIAVVIGGFNCRDESRNNDEEDSEGKSDNP